MGNGIPQLSKPLRDTCAEETGLSQTVIQGLHTRFFYIGQGKKGKDLLNHSLDAFDNDPTIALLLKYGGFGNKIEKMEFKDFLSIFNQYSRHVSGHNKSLKDRLGWIWDFMCHAADPGAKGTKKRFLQNDTLLPILKLFDPDGNHTLESATAVIEEMVEPGVKTIDRSAFVRYIGECIPNCNTYMEIDYDKAYGVSEEDAQREKDLFDEDTKNNNLANLSDSSS